MHNRLIALGHRKNQVRRDETRARGSAEGSVTVGSAFIERRRRSVAVTNHMTRYSIGEDGTTTTVQWSGFGWGALGSTFGFMSQTGGSYRG